MSKINDGGPAFPTEKFTAYRGGGGYSHRDGGMTLRDYFAAKAMVAIISKHRAVISEASSEDGVNWPNACAKGAYAYADAMLAARGKE